MKDTSILANHDISIMTVLNLQKIGDQTVGSERMDEVASLGLAIQHFLKSLSLPLQLINGDGISHALHDASLMREW